MASPLKPNKDLFQTAFGEGLVRFGFPAKIHLKTNGFVQATEIGAICVFVIPHTHHAPQGNNAAVDVRVACSIKSVQEVLEKTELYVPDGTLTWTFGLDVCTLREEKRGIIAKLRKQFVNPWYEFDASSTEAFVREMARLALVHFEQFGWPFLQATSLSKEGALKLMLQNNRITRHCFLTKSHQSLATLVLARDMGRNDLIPLIFKQTRDWFAKVDNEYDAQKFECVAESLGFEGA